MKTSRIRLNVQVAQKKASLHVWPSHADIPRAVHDLRLFASRLQSYMYEPRKPFTESMAW